MSKILIYSEENQIRKNLVEFLENSGHLVEDMSRNNKNYDVCYLIFKTNDPQEILSVLEYAQNSAKKIILINPIVGNTELDFAPRNYLDAAAIYAEMLLKVSGIDYTIFRLPKNLISSNYLDSGLVYNWIVSALSKKQIIIPGNGENTDSFTCLDSILPVLESAIENYSQKTFNLGNSEKVKINYIANLVANIAARRGFRCFVDNSFEEYQSDFDFSTSKIEKETGFKYSDKLLDTIEELFYNIENGD